MSKKLTILLAVILILAVSVPVAYAAISDNQQKEINQLAKQMLEIRKQIVDKYVAAGQITPEQGKQIKSQIDQMYKNHSENGGFAGPGMMGGGMMGRGGCGGMGGGGSSAPANPEKKNFKRGIYNSL